MTARIVVSLCLLCCEMRGATADDVLAAYVSALGGKERLERTRTRVLEGVMEVRGRSAPVTFYRKAPDRIMVETRLPGGTLRRGHDGTGAWESSSRGGMRRMNEKERLAMVEELSLLQPLRLHDIFPKRELLDGGAVRMTRSSGMAETWYFDAQTHFLVRMEKVIDGGPQGEIPVTILLEDYRTVDGLSVPFRVTTKTPVLETVHRFAGVRHDVEVPDANFQASSEAK